MSMTEQKTGQEWRSALVLGVIIVLFLAPLMLAWYVAREYKPGSGGGGEHGILIHPPRALDNLDLFDPISGMKTSLYGRWTMFAIIKEEGCGKECREVLYRMRQVHIAMGEKLYRVQRAVYFAEGGAEAQTADIFSGYEGQLLLAHDQAGNNFINNFLLDGKSYDRAIFLIDPRGFLMMCYPGNTNPGGIIKDLKRLLRTAG